MDAKAYAKGSEEQVGKWFRASEFDCSCSGCSYTFISPVLIARLDRLRDLLGARVVILSGFRCDYKQAELLAQDKARVAQGQKPVTVKDSTHTRGWAADIRSDNRSGADLEIFAAEAGFKAIGVAKDWIHCDTRSDKRRTWGY